MADVEILAQQVAAAPLNYQIPGGQEIVLKCLAASFDGAAAASPWQPAIQVVGPSGQVLRTFPLGTTIAAGASADVTWFPRGGVSAGGTPGSTDLFWPAADQADAAYDKTTYPNEYTGVGNLDVLAFAANSGPAVALAVQGDAFPRVVITPNAGDSSGFSFRGIRLSDGVSDPFTAGAGIACFLEGAPGDNDFVLFNYNSAVAASGVGRDGSSDLGVYGRFHLLSTQGGALGVNHMAGKGAPSRGGDVGDKYWRSDGAAGSYLYTCTVAGDAGAATWVAIL